MADQDTPHHLYRTYDEQNQDVRDSELRTRKDRFVEKCRRFRHGELPPLDATPEESKEAIAILNWRYGKSDEPVPKDPDKTIRDFRLAGCVIFEGARRLDSRKVPAIPLFQDHGKLRAEAKAIKKELKKLEEEAEKKQDPT